MIQKNGLNPSFNPESKDSIISELITFKNKHGNQIVGFHDHCRDSSGNEPYIIILPGYGETKRDGLSTAYYLVKNGFNVLRYDNTNHVGESDGDIVNTTLSQMKNDLISTIDFSCEKFKITTCGVIASSLAKRVAMKAASEDNRISFLLGIVGVVDLKDTLQAAYKEDMIGSCLKGKKWGITEVLGFEVSGEFLESAIRDNFHDLSSTIEDASKVNIPIVFLVAENDAWVKLDHTKLVFERLNNKKSEFYLIPDALHQLQENPQAAKTALKQIVLSCKKHLEGFNVELNAIIEPTIKELAVQNRIEKDRLKKLIKISKKTENDFWSKYLQQFFFIVKSSDYKKYLTDIETYIGEIRNDEFVLDVGCGNGHFGAWISSGLLKKHSNHSLDSLIKFNYVGVDVVEASLKDAKNRIYEFINDVIRKTKISSSNLKCSFILSDLDYTLPFNNSSIDRICCSLVISYVENYQKSVNEMLRILKPGGKIVISSLKPHNDLSAIYRNFVDTATSEEEIIEGRKLLNNAGQISQKEKFGHYHFFSKESLTCILSNAGAKNISTYRSFGNQANIAVAEK